MGSKLEMQGNPILDLPIKDRSKRAVRVSGDIWTIYGTRGIRRLDFGLIPLRKQLREGFKLWIAEQLRTSAPATVEASFGAVQRILGVLAKNGVITRSWQEIGEAESAMALSACRKEGGRRLGDFTPWRNWASWCAEFRLPGFRPLGRELSRTKIGRSWANRAVIEEDPVKGPFSEQELADVVSSLAAPRKQLTTREEALLRIALHLGPNTGWVCNLTWEDFRVEPIDGSGMKLYSLRFPRGTKRRGAVQPRKDFMPWRGLDPQLGSLLEKMKSENEAEIEIPHGFSTPIFPIRNLISIANRKTAFGHFAYHQSNTNLHEELEKAVQKLGLRSERNAGVLKATFRRFRYTFATRLLAQGHPIRWIAFLLDHNQLRTLKVYAAAQAGVVEAATRDIFPMAHRELIGRFMGQIVEGFSKDRASVWATDTSGELLTLGRCASSGCSWDPASACYSCPHFLASADAAHERFLATLEARKEILKARRFPTRSDAGQLDMAIAGVKAVINTIRVVKALKQAEKEGFQGIVIGDRFDLSSFSMKVGIDEAWLESPSIAKALEDFCKANALVWMPGVTQ